jgi:hypothetical protein
MTSSREGHYRVEACSEGTMFDVPTRERGEVAAQRYGLFTVDLVAERWGVRDQADGSSSGSRSLACQMYDVAA